MPLSLPPPLNTVWADLYGRYKNPWTVSVPPVDVLKDPSVIYPFILSACLQIFTFFILQYAYPKQFAQTRKQRAWILTLQNSVVTTLGSLPFLYQFALNGFSLVNYPSLDTPYARGLTAFFLTYLLADLIIGSIYYREHMDPMTGWFHHTLYTFLGFKVLQWRVPGFLGLYFFLEAPTLLLSMGQINKVFRKDMLYGSVFFSTRIVFHLVLSARLFMDFHNFLFLPTISVFPIHILWFRRWIVQQIKKRSAARVTSIEKSTSAETALVAPATSSPSLHIPRRSSFRGADSRSASPTPLKPKRRFLGVMAAAQQPAMARLQQQALRLLRYRRGSSNSLP